MPETKKPKKPKRNVVPSPGRSATEKQKKTKETKTKASQHQSNKQRVTVNVQVGNRGRGKSKGGSRQPPQQQAQPQVRPSTTVVNVAQPLPPMPQAPYVAIPSERPAERITMIPGATVAGNMQGAVDRSLSETHSMSSIPTLMGSYAPAGHTIKMPVFEDDSVSEMSFDTPISPRPNPPMDMSEFLALALPFKEQPISQPISAMKAYAKEPAPYMMPIPMSAEELDFKRYYNNMNRSVASSVEPSEGPAPLGATYIKSEKGSVSSGKGPAPSIASPDRATARRLDAGSVFSTPSHIEFRERMTDDSGINAERLKRMSKTELADQYMKYYKVQPHKGKTKAVLLDDVLKRFRK